MSFLCKIYKKGYCILLKVNIFFSYEFWYTTINNMSPEDIRYVLDNLTKRD